jgi:hypothetical protein
VGGIFAAIAAVAIWRIGVHWRRIVRQRSPLLPAWCRDSLEAGLVSESDIDAAVRRLLLARCGAGAETSLPA